MNGTCGRDFAQAEKKAIDVEFIPAGTGLNHAIVDDLASKQYFR
jgi:hypothetical protein